MNENRKNVLLTEYIHPEARRLLEQHVNIISDLKDIAEVDALIDRNEIKVDQELLDQATRLKIVGVHGTGMDVVDLNETRKRGITVFNTPGLNARSVAELNVALILDLSRNISRAAARVQEGEEISNKCSGYMGNEISGKTVGLIGVGNITKQTAVMLQAGFGAEIMAWSRSLTSELASQLGFQYCETMEEVLKQADIIMLGLAANEDTYHIIGREQLQSCRPSALLINTARGSLIDEQALYQALTEGWIRGAASDVFETEPVTNSNPLVGLEQFLAVPHLGANTEEALYRVGMAVVTGVLQRLGVKGF